MKLNKIQIDALASEIYLEAKTVLEEQIERCRESFLQNDDSVRTLDLKIEGIIYEIKNTFTVEDLEDNYSFKQICRSLEQLKKESIQYPEEFEILLKKLRLLTKEKISRQIILSTIDSETDMETLKNKIINSLIN